MTAYSRTIRKLLMAAGTMQILLGLAHFILPGLVFQSKGFQLLSSAETDLVTLCMVSVGILLLAAGIISMICAVRYNIFKDISLLITLVFTVVWFTRIILEMLFPVSISLLFIKIPTYIIMPLLLVLFGLFAMTVLLMLKDTRK